MNIPKILLGNTGLSITRLGCGLARIGRLDYGTNSPNQEKLLTKSEIFLFLQTAITLGINFFDTASSYGQSEKMLGDFLAENPLLRDEVVIATKCGEHFDPGKSATYWNHSQKALRCSIEQSLRYLKYIHLLQIHGVTLEVLKDDQVLTMLEQYQQRGDIGFLGITSRLGHQDAVGESIKMQLFSSIQVTYNPAMRQMEQFIGPAAKNQMGVIVNRPLGEGLFSVEKEPYLSEAQKASLQDIKIQAGRVGLEQYAWNFIFSNPNVAAVLSGTRNAEHLCANVRNVKGAL